MWSLSPLPQLHAFGTSKEACKKRQTAGSPHDQGPPQFLPTNSALGHVWNATLSTLHGAGERAPDPQALTVVRLAVHLPPQPMMTLLHPDLLGERASTTGDTPSLCLLQLGQSQPPPLSLTNLSHSLGLPPSAKSAGASGRPHLHGITFWALLHWCG